MLSIIIPTFNRQESTERAVRSVISQNVETEILIIDDGSTIPFQLHKELKKYKNIKLVYKDENMGAAAARNTGLELATHTLVSFLDSDDFFLPDTLESRLDFAIQHDILKDSGKANIVGCSWHETNSKNEIARTRHPLASKSPDDFYSGCWFCPGSAIIANREFLIRGQMTYDEHLIRLEDLDLFMRLSHDGATYIPQHIIGVSITSSDSRYPDTVIKACRQIHEKHLKEPTKLNEKRVENLKSYLFYELSRAHITKREYHRALDYLVKSFIQKPRLKLYPGPGWLSKPD